MPRLPNSSCLGRRLWWVESVLKCSCVHAGVARNFGSSAGRHTRPIANFGGGRGSHSDGDGARLRPRDLFFQLSDLVHERAASNTEMRLEEIEAGAVQIMGRLNHINIAEGFHLYGKMSVRPGKAMMQGLERQAAARMHEFGPRGIANIMVAYAKMRVFPGEGILPGLEGRAAALMPGGCFGAQGVANTMWAYAALGSPPGDALFSELCRAAQILVDGDSLDEREVEQLHLFLLCAKLEGWSINGDSSPVDALRMSLGKRGRDLLAHSLVAKTSKLQADVAVSARRLGLEIEEQAIDDESGYSIDILITDRTGGDAVSRGGLGGGGGPAASASIRMGKSRAGSTVAIEVDGPWHYLMPRGREANGATQLKRRILSRLGYQLVSVPHWEWRDLEGNAAKDAYLWRALRLASKCQEE